MTRQHGRKKVWRKCCQRRGMVLLTVCIALVALLGFAALTVDIGRLAMATQRAQSVADAAGLAAALRLPDQGDANLALTDIVAANNAEVTWPQVVVDTSQDVTYYDHGDEVPSYGVLAANESAVTVTVHVDTEYTFARALGHEEMHTERSATAKVTTSSDTYPCLFAGEEATTTTGITVNGSGARVEGDTHSNTRITLNGSGHYFLGPVVYRNRLIVNGSGIELVGGSQEGAILSYPMDYTWDDFLPWDYEVSSICVNGSGRSMEFGRTHVLGDVTINGSGFHGYDGLLLVEGNVTFNGSGHLLENVTIVAKGSIVFNGSCQSVTPYTEDLALMSLKSSSGTVITFNGSSQDSYGTFFAPNGNITYNGSSQKHQYGSIIAKRITVNGSSFYIHGTEASGGGVKTVQLIR